MTVLEIKARLATLRNRINVEQDDRRYKQLADEYDRLEKQLQQMRGR